jgi:hypothetical protein
VALLHCGVAVLRVQVANARQLEGSKGSLGVVNWISEKLLNAAHLRRSNTREGELQAVLRTGIPLEQLLDAL